MRSVLVAAAAIAFSARDARYSALAGGSSDDKEANTTKSQSLRRVRSCKNDDARDPLNPRERASYAYKERKEAAEREQAGTRKICQFNNEETNTAAMFHKTLPHDDLGQVDPVAFEALEECIYSGNFDVCEAVPSGEPSGFLINPIAGVAIDMAGPASHAVTTPPLPTLDSAELAAQLAEVYWMALARDVPFSQYGLDEVTIAAAENLAAMPGFPDAFGVAKGTDGSVDPHSQLFRANFVGVETGPMVSQLLIKDFTLDSITVTPKQSTFTPGVDYMTSYDNWLHIQNGGAPDGPEERDPIPRFIRNARDLATIASTDTIYTEAFRASLILLAEGAISAAGFNGPYTNSIRQKGFLEYGVSHLMRALGGSEGAQRSSWYQKWQVHLFVRPEALAGTVHNTLIGALSAPIHTSLLENEELLQRVAASNGAQNADEIETYLLSQAVKIGSPAHPSYPAGHAVQNGAYATLFKAMTGLERGFECFSNPVYPDDDGLELIDYTGGCLTYEGEINKLAANVAFGRQMMGVHYRFDSTEGLVLGETVAVRKLHQEAMSLPEQHPFEFRLFTGEEIKLYSDGTFAIDGKKCQGEIYTGASNC